MLALLFLWMLPLVDAAHSLRVMNLHLQFPTGVVDRSKLARRVQGIQAFVTSQPVSRMCEPALQSTHF